MFVVHVVNLILIVERKPRIPIDTLSIGIGINLNLTTPKSLANQLQFHLGDNVLWNTSLFQCFNINFFAKNRASILIRTDRLVVF